MSVTFQKPQRRSSIEKMKSAFKFLTPCVPRTNEKPLKHKKVKKFSLKQAQVPQTRLHQNEISKKISFASDSSKKHRSRFKLLWESIKNSKSHKLINKRNKRLDSVASTSSTSTSSTNLKKSFPGVVGSRSEILYTKNIKEIQQNLPYRNKASYWYKLYSNSIDGLNLDTFYTAVEDEDDTVVLIETTKGEIFGAFMTEAWKKNSRGKYYGTGESFVFKFCNNKLNDIYSELPFNNSDTIALKKGCGANTRTKVRRLSDLTSSSVEQKSSFDEPCFCEEEKRLMDKQRFIRIVELNQMDFEAYKWNQVHDSFMISSDTFFGVGKGNGADTGFALFVNENFHGETKISETFCNPPLVNQENGNFEIRRLEVFGFTSCKRNPKLLKKLRHFKQLEEELVGECEENEMMKKHFLERTGSMPNENVLKVSHGSYDYANTLQGADAKEMLHQFRLECDHFHRQLTHGDGDDANKTYTSLDGVKVESGKSKLETLFEEEEEHSA
eukprot:maker-scaffold_4-snap-gene-0.9-mRNA-1 protein AED:0.00 eAED:0.00 QI:78/1/1/1/1/1/3/118/497